MPGGGWSSSTEFPHDWLCLYGVCGVENGDRWFRQNAQVSTREDDDFWEFIAKYAFETLNFFSKERRHQSFMSASNS